MVYIFIFYNHVYHFVFLLSFIATLQQNVIAERHSYFQKFKAIFILDRLPFTM